MTRRAGLSLFELLIALALLALLSAGLAGALDMTLRLHDRVRATPEASEAAGLRIRLRNWLAAPVSPQRIVPYPTDLIAREDRLEFTTTHARDFAPGAAALRIVLTPQGQDLTMAITALDDDGEPLETYDAKLPGTDPVRFRYPEGPRPAYVAIDGLGGLVLEIGAQ
jgi:prepilin-type N-terminal cleavage/methylation domain-containing protein